MMDAEETKGMGWHLTDNACRRCNRLVKAASVRGLAEMLRTGKAAVERVRTLADAAVGMLASLPVASGAFAPDETPGHLARQEGANGLDVSVRNSAAGEFVVAVSAAGQEFDGKRVTVELLGKQTLTDVLTLRSQGEAGCAGRLVFGRFEEAAMLGADYAALVLPTDGIDQMLLR